MKKSQPNNEKIGNNWLLTAFIIKKRPNKIDLKKNVIVKNIDANNSSHLLCMMKHLLQI
jgi:hypothetical protein